VSRWSLVTVLVLAGCFGEPRRDFLPGHDSAVDVVDSPACSTVATSAAAVILVAESGTAPTAAGGVVADATYVLESKHGYDITPTDATKLTVRFTGTLWENASRGTEPTDTRQGGSLIYKSASSVMTLLVLCGDGALGERMYTFNTGDGSLDWIIPMSGGAVEVWHFRPM